MSKNNKPRVQSTFGSWGKALAQEDQYLAAKEKEDESVIMNAKSDHLSQAQKDTAKNIMEAAKKPQEKKYLVIVHRVDENQKNKSLFIDVAANNANNRKKFYPGEKVMLNETQINVLFDANYPRFTPIADTSSTYQAQNPHELAAQMNPGCTLDTDPKTGRYRLKKMIQKYSVQFADEEDSFRRRIIAAGE